jgi:transposase
MIPIYAVDIANENNVCFDGTSVKNFKNTESGVKVWVDKLKPNSIVALEPTGGYSELVATAAYKAGHTVFMIQPAWIKSHRSSLGRRAKTDPTDAKLIYDYVESKKDKLFAWKPMDEDLANLKRLVRQRQGLAQDRSRMRQRLKALQVHPTLIATVLDGVETVIKELEVQIKAALKTFPESKVLLSIKGIGPISAAYLLTVLKHIEFKNVDSFIAWIGIDPVPSDSGNRKAPRRISKRGDKHLRSALFVGAMAAIRSTTWSSRYERFIAKGLKPHQALVAIAKKLATVAYHLFKKQVVFDPDMVALPKAA